MIQVLGSSWALLFGMFLLMLGNGVQGTLLGIRGGIEDFSTFEMSIVMSGYFVGFLFGSRMTPELIRRVGHIRVFAALGSFCSAVLILYPTVVDPWAWIILRVIVGFCFSGIYVVAESWLNNSTNNENRGKALSLYLIVQMGGIIAAQALLNLGDPSGYVVFVISSVLVSLAFAPILLAATPTPAFETTKPMTLKELYGVSPLGCVGIFVLGGVFSAMFGMSAVYGTEVGLSVSEIAIFVAVIYVGGLVLQFPIGWLSDRIDRRQLILGVTLIGGSAALIGGLFGSNTAIIVSMAFILGGTANPLYGLIIAYTNDFLDFDRMAGASAGLIFINGIGAIAGPIVIGWMMGLMGPSGFWLFIAILLLGLSAYAVWRMQRRPDITPVDETVAYAPVTHTFTPIAAQVAEEFYAESLEENVSESATIETVREGSS